MKCGDTKRARKQIDPCRIVLSYLLEPQVHTPSPSIGGDRGPLDISVCGSTNLDR